MEYHPPEPADPRFPPELESSIFQTAALSRPTTILNLMLVARRVKYWYVRSGLSKSSNVTISRVEPFLYRVVLCSNLARFGLTPVFTVSILKEIIADKSQEFLHKAVRNLFLDYSVDRSAAESFLAACSGIRNLFALFNADGYMRYLGILQDVQVLAIDVKAIFERVNVDVPHPLFLNVTHLELLDMTDISAEKAADVCAHLASIPRLTHVALNITLHDIVSHTDLQADTRLKCIVFLSSQPGRMEDTSPLCGDARFVFIQQTEDCRLDWVRGATTGDDYWALADAFIAARRAGKIDRMFIFSFLV
jgi:hypothetical protein